MTAYRRMQDISGQKFNRLTVISPAGKDSNRCVLWLCQCDCGNTTTATGADLKRGHKKSCGCLKLEACRELGRSSATHGKRYSAEYRVWCGMTRRCRSPNDPKYPDYGGRGIKVCEEWLSFENFYRDMGERPTKAHSIDRKDNDGDYEPGNCRWATQVEQSRNQRISRRSKTGVRGVYWKQQAGKYQARIGGGKRGRRISLGYFETLEEAEAARKSAEAKYWAKDGQAYQA